ncbi:MAG: 3'-5' exonuclease, partial [Acinetobacter sp.]|nr:3'-5' exonuclease [Acinetobacter sp.]
LYEQGILKDPENYFKDVELSLNFPPDCWQFPEMPQPLKLFKAIPFERGEELSFLFTDFKKGITPTGQKTLDWFATEYQNLYKFQQEQNTEPGETIRKSLKSLPNIKSSQTKGIDKVPANIMQQWQQHPIIIACKEYADCIDNFKEQMQSYLLGYLIQSVQQQLPALLEQHHETLFSLQTRHLANALNPSISGETSEKFANAVHHRYPVILVDEFQDTNQDQDQILHTIWRTAPRYQQGCMVMVGDDKQAIYSFRGGDILTYEKVRQSVEQLAQNHQARLYTLDKNHRTVQPLVAAVDALFQRKADFGESVHYEAIHAGERPHPALIDQGQENHTPLRWVFLQEKEQQAEQVVFHIQHLLQQSAQGTLYFQHGEQKTPISVNDIAILATKKDYLAEVQDLLNQYKIPNYFNSKKSVFESVIARDVGHLLNAIVSPYNEQKLNRVLLSRLFAWKLSELQQPDKQNELSVYMQKLAEINETWQKYGFLTAWQKCLQTFDIWQNLVKNAHSESERFVINLRHLSEILSEHSERHHGIQHLLAWYHKQLNYPQERDWEIERKLSNTHGVQMMTIHASKGLEFKIVFLLTADENLSNKDTSTNFIFSKNANNERQISITHNANEQDEQHLREREQSERHRLWYVALTRASHRVYAMMSATQEKLAKVTDGKITRSIGLAYWYAELTAGAGIYQHPASGVITEQMQEISSAYHDTPSDHNAPQWQTIAQPHRTFYKVEHTSFSSLTKDQDHRQAKDPISDSTIELDDPDVFDISNEDIIATTRTPLPWLANHMPKGAEAGLFLHSVLEHISLQKLAKASDYKAELNSRLKNDAPGLLKKLLELYQAKDEYRGANEEQLKNQLCEDLTDWLQAIVNTPFAGTTLAEIPKTHRQHEMTFTLALQNQKFDVQKIEQLFAQHGLSLQLNDAFSARYLAGAIDLVFFDGERYHIADFKSNSLGDTFEHYQAQYLNQKMQEKQYQLQASIYLVALHRLLKTRLAHYDIQQHLGAAHFLFLRGMSPIHEQHGIWSWQADANFILELDEILGTPNSEQC